MKDKTWRIRTIIPDNPIYPDYGTEEELRAFLLKEGVAQGFPDSPDSFEPVFEGEVDGVKVRDYEASFTE